MRKQRPPAAAGRTPRGHGSRQRRQAARDRPRTRTAASPRATSPTSRCRPTELERIWNTEYLERLARTYWRFLTRVSLGLIQVEYGPDSREIVLVTKPFVLLRFFAPEYETDQQRRHGHLADQQGPAGRAAGPRQGLPADRGRAPRRPEHRERDRAARRLRGRELLPAARGLGLVEADRRRHLPPRPSTRSTTSSPTRSSNSLATLDLEESKVGKFRSRLPGAGKRPREPDDVDPPPRETEVAQQQTPRGLADPAAGDLAELRAVVRRAGSGARCPSASA